MSCSSRAPRLQLSFCLRLLAKPYLDSLLFQLFLLFLLLLSTSVDGITQQYPIADITPFNVGRFVALATDGPALAVLSRSPQLRARIAPSFDVFRTLAAVIDHRVESNNSRACNLRDVPWVTISKDNIRVHQFGEYSDYCRSRFDMNEAVREGEVYGEFAAGLRNDLKSARRASADTMKKVSAIPDSTEPARNWTDARYPLQGWDLVEGGRRCSLDFLFAYRINERWYLQLDVTNNPVESYMPDWERQGVVEFVREDFQANKELPHAMVDSDEIVMATTFLQRWGGVASFSSTGRMTADENPALMEAARLNRKEVELAKDSVTPSNVAILALPMVLSIIPVAFVADLSGCGMFWYIIFTDVFSTVPFLIKGVELLTFAKTTRTETVAYSMGNSTLGQMEVWAADCRGEDSFRVIGIFFICIGLVITALGLALEIAAGLVMRKRRAVKGHSATGPFGMALFKSTLFAPVGVGNDEERREHLVAEVRRLYPQLFEQALRHVRRISSTVRPDSSGRDEN